MTAIERLRSELAMYAETGRMTPSSYHYAGWPDFLQREGEEFECAPCPPNHYMQPGFCYGNAIVVGAVIGLAYVEGMACPRHDMPAVPHAWNLNAEGRVIDSTWALAEDHDFPPEGRAYVGVRFSVARADEATWDGDACVLDDWKRRWPVLREPWQPEDSPGPLDELPARFAARSGQVNVSPDRLERAFALRMLSAR